MIISSRSFGPLVNAINYWSQKPKLHLSTNAYKIPVFEKISFFRSRSQYFSENLQLKQDVEIETLNPKERMGPNAF